METALTAFQRIEVIAIATGIGVQLVALVLTYRFLVSAQAAVTDVREERKQSLDKLLSNLQAAIDLSRSTRQLMDFVSKPRTHDQPKFQDLTNQLQCKVRPLHPKRTEIEPEEPQPC